MQGEEEGKRRRRRKEFEPENTWTPERRSNSRSGDDAHVHTSINKEQMHASLASITGAQRVPAGASEKTCE